MADVRGHSDRVVSGVLSGATLLAGVLGGAVLAAFLLKDGPRLWGGWWCSGGSRP